MASISTQPIAIADIMILTPVMTFKLEGHEIWNVSTSDGKQHKLKDVSCISCFSDGKQMISGSSDKTIRRWDLRKGKEIEKDQEVYEDVHAVGVSRDGRWVVIAGGNDIKVSKVETGIVRTFHEGSWTNCINISADSTLLVGGSSPKVRIWNLDTGELMHTGPFDIGDNFAAALRFSEDSWKLAVMSYSQSKERFRHVQVWDAQAQKLDVQKSTQHIVGLFSLPIFWTTKDKSIVTTFSFTANDNQMIYEFDPSMLKTVGAPFKHTSPIFCLALSSDCVLLASSSYPNINLWAFESRQLLASFNIANPRTLILSPDSCQLAYTTWNNTKIRICDIPANILANIESVCVPAYIHHLYANILTDQQI
jgi:WD40 repeat protein